MNNRIPVSTGRRVSRRLFAAAAAASLSVVPVALGEPLSLRPVAVGGQAVPTRPDATLDLFSIGRVSINARGDAAFWAFWRGPADPDTGFRGGAWSLFTLRDGVLEERARDDDLGSSGQGTTPVFMAEDGTALFVVRPFFSPSPGVAGSAVYAAPPDGAITEVYADRERFLRPSFNARGDFVALGEGHVAESPLFDGGPGLVAWRCPDGFSRGGCELELIAQIGDADASGRSVLTELGQGLLDPWGRVSFTGRVADTERGAGVFQGLERQGTTFRIAVEVGNASPADWERLGFPGGHALRTLSLVSHAETPVFQLAVDDEAGELVGQGYYAGTSQGTFAVTGHPVPGAPDAVYEDFNRSATQPGIVFAFDSAIVDADGDRAGAISMMTDTGGPVELVTRSGDLTAHGEIERLLHDGVGLSAASDVVFLAQVAGDVEPAVFVVVNHRNSTTQSRDDASPTAVRVIGPGDTVSVGGEPKIVESFVRVTFEGTPLGVAQPDSSEPPARLLLVDVGLTDPVTGVSTRGVYIIDLAELPVRCNAADIDMDGDNDVIDVLALVNSFNPAHPTCQDPGRITGCTPADVDADGDNDVTDVLRLLLWFDPAGCAGL